MAVVAILASIAVPSYQEQIRKSRRAQAKSDGRVCADGRTLLHGQQHVCGLCPADDAVATEAGATARYLLALNPAPGATTFTITATAQARRATTAKPERYQYGGQGTHWVPFRCRSAGRACGLKPFKAATIRGVDRLAGRVSLLR